MKITLKDGSVKEYGEAKSIQEIASDLSEGLGRMAACGIVNGETPEEEILAIRPSPICPIMSLLSFTAAKSSVHESLSITSRSLSSMIFENSTRSFAMR